MKLIILSLLLLALSTGCSLLASPPPILSGQCLVNSCYPGRLKEWEAMTTNEAIDFLKWEEKNISLTKYNEVISFFVFHHNIDEAMIINHIEKDDLKGVRLALAIISMKIECTDPTYDYSKLMAAVDKRLLSVEAGSELEETLLVQKGVFGTTDEDTKEICDVERATAQHVIRGILDTSNCSKRELREAEKCAANFTKMKQNN